jgi:putative transposase
MLTLNYQYRIYPDASQEQQMLEWLETLRISYNYALREVKDWLASRKSPWDRCYLNGPKVCYILPASEPFPGEQIQQKNLAKAKKDFPRLKEVPSQALQQNIKRLHKAMEGLRKEGKGFPRFKKVGGVRSFLFPQFKANPIDTAKGVISLPKVGKVPITLHRAIPDGFVVKQIRVIAKARGTQWYVNVNIQSPESIPETPYTLGKSIGIDVGISSFLTTSDGTKVEFPRFFRSSQAKLKLLQRRADRKVKRSKNHEKAKIKVARLHLEIANARKDFHYKVAHWLCDIADNIFYEDLNIKGLTRGFLAKDCLDAAWGQFFTILKQVCFKRGKNAFAVDPRGTSQICPLCKGHTPKKLGNRWHKCLDLSCGFETDRDHASAMEIDDRGNNKMLQDFGVLETA